MLFVLKPLDFKRQFATWFLTHKYLKGCILSSKHIVKLTVLQVYL